MGRALHGLQFETFFKCLMPKANAKTDWLCSIIHVYIVQSAVYTICYVQYPNIMVIEVCEVRRLQYGKPHFTTACVHFYRGCILNKPTNISRILVAPVFTTFDHRRSGLKLPCKFYIHGSVHHESNLITVQQDATYSVYYISVGSCTCFGCWHPSSGARTTVITASGID